jgi:hypothetical protein
MNNSPTCKALLALLLLTTTATACGAGAGGTTSSALQTASGTDENNDPAGAVASDPPAATGGAGQPKDLTKAPANGSPAAPTAPTATPTAVAASDLDEDGVKMLLPSAPGTNFRLGANDPNNTDGFLIENNMVATEQQLGSLRYWNTDAFNLDYTGGGSGKTARLHIISGEQKFTWRNQSGFLSSPNDLKNQEFTAYVRVHDVFDASRAMVTMKIRGGKHWPSNGDLASCTMMTLSVNGNSMFGKELTHPNYDYVKLTPQTNASLKDNQWVGLKVISYAEPGDPTKVVNQLYVDMNPFDASGKPLNEWRLMSEYVDTEGTSTGRYSKLADWGAEQTTVRTDGVGSIDFALVSAREITPPN